MASSARVPTADNWVRSTRELREKYNSRINADPALVESRRWIEVVTGQRFKNDNFRESLAGGILLCELIEILAGAPLGRINRLPTAYAGIDNLNLFFKGCEGLGLKKLHLFDVADLQEVTLQRGDSISSRAKETQRRLQNVAITILWLAKAAQKHGYQGPPLNFSCFNHLLPKVHFQGKKERQTRKRHSLGDLENRKRSTDNIPLKKRDRVFEKVDIRDRKEKFQNLEKESKKEPVVLEPSRRRSTGGILKKIKEQHWDQEEGTPSRRENKQSKVKMPDPKFHEKQELYSRREKQAEMEASVLEEKTRPRGSGSGRVTSPPPISLGRKVEVDLKEKQKKFEGLDRQAEQQSAVLSGKTRSVPWGPNEIRPALKKQNPVDVGLKEKHRNYEQLQRQATTESAVLEGKLRPQFDRVDGRPDKVPLSTKTDVKLREKRKDFEQRDYQAQREKAVLEGNLRLSREDGKGKRPNSVVVPKREQVKLDEKKATFEQLDKQAGQDASILRGEHRPPLTETDGRKRSSKVGLPRESYVGLLEKQRTFEAMDYQARKESEILQKNKRKSFDRSVRQPAPLSTSTRPQIARFHSPSDRPADASDVRRRNQQDRPSRPVSNYYEYSSFQSDYPQSVNKNATSEGHVEQVFSEEALQSIPSYAFESMNYNQNQRVPVGDEQLAIEERRREYSHNARRRYEESRRRRSSGEEPLEIDVSDAKNLSYRDMVRAPPKKSRETFIREANNIVVAEMPWRKEVREVKGIKHLTPEVEQDSSGARPSASRSELGKGQYLELVVPPSKRAMDNFASDHETVGRTTEEIPRGKEVKEIRRSSSGEETQAFVSATLAQPAEVIRPPSLKTRDSFVAKQDDKPEEEMPWRKEVRELKTRATEDEEDFREESPPLDIDSSAAPNLRKFSYKEFINVPARKRRAVFQAEAVNNEEKEEMPWRKEVREIKRSTTDEEEESTAALSQPAPEHSYRGPTSLELVAKPPRKARDSFVPYEAKQREEMPWRKEVREIKRTITEDEQIPRSSATNTHSSPEDQRDLRKFSYRDFVDKPRKKSEGFLSTEEKEKEEMPWRKEVRELREKPGDEEQISQSSRSELETTPSDALYRSSVRPPQSTPYENKRELSRNGTYYPGRDIQNMSYKDFVCPPSKVIGQGQRKSTKVKDLTKKFANIEAEKDCPKQSGPPSRKSLVDVAELQRIERDMKTRSWHGFPSNEYEDDDDFEIRRLQRTRSEEEQDERFRQQHQRENVSGLEELDDVFQDPEGYFDQMQVPPPEKSVGKEARVQYEAPSWKERDERKEQVVTVRSTNDQYGQASLYATGSGDFYQTKPIRDEPSQKHRPSDDRVVVKQSFIQANRVDLAEASRSAPEPVRTESIPKDNSQYVSQQYRNDRPYQWDYRKNEPYQPNRDGRREEENVVSKRSDFNEEKCFIEQNEHPQENQRYLPYDNGYRKQDQVPKQNEHWTQREMLSETKEQQVQHKKKPAKNDGGMVFGGPIVVTARPSQKSGNLEVRHQQFGSYDFVAGEASDTRVVRDDRQHLPAQDRSYNNRYGTSQDDTEKVKNARNLVLQDIKNLVRKDPTEPSEGPKMAHRPHVFGVFARSDPNETQRRDDLHERQLSELSSKEAGDNFAETRRGHLLYFEEKEHTDARDRKTVEKKEDNSWQHVEEGYGYENSVSDNTRLHPTVVSMVESQTEQWGSGAFDASPLKDEQPTGRRRVLNFSDVYGDDVAGENNDEVLQTVTEPVQVDTLETDRKREQKEKEEMLREQLRDAEYREKYRKEFEEKNRKQRENSKYLMSLQMRAALGSDEEVDFSQDAETQREVEQRPREDYNWKTDKSNVSDEDLVHVAVAGEDHWYNKMEKNVERQNRETRRKQSDDLQPPINGVDYVGEDDFVHREYRDLEQEARLRKLKAEEEFEAQEDDRLKREKVALKQQTHVEEPVISPVEKPPVEFTINDEAFKSFMTETNREEDSFDENRNRHLPKSEIYGQRDVFYNDVAYPTTKNLEIRDQQRQYSENIPKPQAEVLPMNGYHHETKDYMDTPTEKVEHNEHYPGHPGTDPEVNGFEGYSIYETFIHGESNHVICMSCGTSIEKSPAMYIAELDRYWHVNCFSCVVCRAWFGDEYSPVLQITNSMLHCERCYITSEGERCTEV